MPVRVLRGPRIIPARAGFTDSGGRKRGMEADHPRSRGVYWEKFCLDGLCYWIIPARAGFTLLGIEQGLQVRDHPRSRGVYDNTADTARAAKGSSPLARGLLGSSSQAPVRSGIIPARAGFTAPQTRRQLERRDHPRSRGVYLDYDGPVTAGGGSSPLARGLPTRGRRPGGSRRIIPARAGFTSTERCCRAPFRDHPRSRGVYVRCTCSSRTGVGSSPLARGLRPR